MHNPGLRAGNKLLSKKIIYIAGLPRSGSTLLCQLLGHHSKVYANSHSSPLAGVISGIRHQISDSEFFLSQLDTNFDMVYEQLKKANIGFMEGWFSTVEEEVVVDKNRHWLKMVETLHLLDPEFQMIVCLRDLRQVFGSIEHQHAKTRLIDFNGHIDPNSAAVRQKGFFKEDGVVGWALGALQNMQGIEDADIRSRILYLSYESLVAEPKETMDKVFDWLNISTVDFDFEALKSTHSESDSHYRMKFPHKTQQRLNHGGRIHKIPEHLETRILQENRWYFEEFYPHVLDS